VYVFSGIATLLIALGTVSLQSFKAANKNPVEVLKNNS
jgi:hypothetical protein